MANYSDCFRFCFRGRFKQRISRGNRLVRSMSKGIALLCLLLTFWLAWAFVAHRHSSATESVKCTVCLVAHSAAPSATAVLQKAPFVPVATLDAGPVAAQQCLLAFALYVRPPPEV
jgi:hypothetical protein